MKWTLSTSPQWPFCGVGVFLRFDAQHIRCASLPQLSGPILPMILYTLYIEYGSLGLCNWKLKSLIPKFYYLFWIKMSLLLKSQFYVSFIEYRVSYVLLLYFYSLKVSTFLFYLPVGPLAQATQRPKTLSSKLECDLWYDLIRGEYGEYWCWYPCRALGAQLDDLMCDSAQLGLVYTIIHFWFHMKWMSLRILTVHPVPTSQWNYCSSCQLTLDPCE